MASDHAFEPDVETAAELEDFKDRLYSQLKDAGVLSSLRGQLRAQLLMHMQKLKGGDTVRSPAADQCRGLWPAAATSLVQDHLRAVQCPFAVSVLQSELDLPSTPTVHSADDVAQLLGMKRHARLQKDFQQHVEASGSLLLALLQSIASYLSDDSQPSSQQQDAACQAADAAPVSLVQQQLQQLEARYLALQQQHTLGGANALERHMEEYRKECDALVVQQVAAQVARVRDVEVAAARQEAAAKYRAQLEDERAELERIHQERLARLRQREEALQERLARQQREVERVAYDARQQILSEEARIKEMRAAAAKEAEERQRLLKQLEAQLQQRQEALAAREAAAARQQAELDLASASRMEGARKQAAAELAEERGALAGQRTALEMERGRVLDMRQAATAELAVVQAKEDRLRAVEASCAEAQARAAAHAAGEEVLRMQLARAQTELASLQGHIVQLGRTGAAPAGSGGAGPWQQQQQQQQQGGPAAAAVGPSRMVDVAEDPGMPMHHGAILDLRAALVELGRLQRRCMDAEAAAEEAELARERALSRSDELSVELNAARREVATLKSRVAKLQQQLLQQRLQQHSTLAANVASGLRPGTAAGRPGTGTAAMRGSPRAGAAAAGGTIGSLASGRWTGAAGAGWGAASSPGGFGTRSAPVSPVSPVRQGWSRGEAAVATSPARLFAATGGRDAHVGKAATEQLSQQEAALQQQLSEFRRRVAAQQASTAQQLAALKAGRTGSIPSAAAAAAGLAMGAASAAGALGHMPGHSSELRLRQDQHSSVVAHQQQQQQSSWRELMAAMSQPSAPSTEAAGAAGALPFGIGSSLAAQQQQQQAPAVAPLHGAGQGATASALGMMLGATPAAQQLHPGGTSQVTVQGQHFAAYAAPDASPGLQFNPSRRSSSGSNGATVAGEASVATLAMGELVPAVATAAAGDGGDGGVVEQARQHVEQFKGSLGPADVDQELEALAAGLEAAVARAGSTAQGSAAHSVPAAAAGPAGWTAAAAAAGGRAGALAVQQQGGAADESEGSCGGNEAEEEHPAAAEGYRARVLDASAGSDTAAHADHHQQQQQPGGDGGGGSARASEDDEFDYELGPDEEELQAVAAAAAVSAGWGAAPGGGLQTSSRSRDSTALEARNSGYFGEAAQTGSGSEQLLEEELHSGILHGAVPGAVPGQAAGGGWHAEEQAAEEEEFLGSSIEGGEAVVLGGGGSEAGGDEDEEEGSVQGGGAPGYDDQVYGEMDEEGLEAVGTWSPPAASSAGAGQQGYQQPGGWRADPAGGDSSEGSVF